MRSKKIISKKAFSAVLLLLVYCWAISVVSASGVPFKSFSSSLTSTAPANGVDDITIDKPPSTVAGDLLIAALTVQDSTAVFTAPAGWTDIRDARQGLNFHSKLFYKVATGAEPADYFFDFDVSGGNGKGTIINYNGDDLSPATPTILSSVNVGTYMNGSETHTYPSLSGIPANHQTLRIMTTGGQGTSWVGSAGTLPGYTLRSGLGDANFIIDSFDKAAITNEPILNHAYDCPDYDGCNMDTVSYGAYTVAFGVGGPPPPPPPPPPSSPPPPEVSCNSPSYLANLNITSDNYHAIFVGNADGTRLNFIGQSASENWTVAETYEGIPYVDGDYLYVVGWNGAWRRGIVFNLTLDGNSYPSSLTNVMATIGPAKAGANNTVRITDGDMAATLGSSPTWYNPSHYLDNDGDPWSVVADVGEGKWIWLDDLNHPDAIPNPNGGITTYPGPDSQNNYIILRTKLTLDATLGDICGAQTNLVSSDPADGSSGVCYTKGLTLNFSEPVYPDRNNRGGTINVSCDGVSVLNEICKPSTFTGGGTATLHKDLIYRESANCKIVISNNCIHNEDDEYWAGDRIEFTTSSSVCTAGVCTPIRILSPLDDSVGVPIGTDLDVTFPTTWHYETAYDVPSRVDIFRSADDSLYGTYSLNISDGSDNSNSILAVSGVGTTTLTIDPKVNFPSSTSFYVQYPHIRLQNCPPDSITDETTWNFTTGADVPIMLQEKLPRNNRVNVNIDTYFELKYDNPAFRGAGSLRIYKASDDTLVDTIPAASARIYGIGTPIVRIFPINGLVYKTDYYIMADEGFLNGGTPANPSEEIKRVSVDDTKKWYFRTIEMDKIPFFKNWTDNR